MSTWVWLAAGVLTQWASVAALRASAGLSRPVWATLTFVAMVASVGCVSVALAEGLAVAVGYGIWTGAGVVLAALTGHVVFGDRLTGRQVVGVVLVVLGVVALQLAA